MTMLVTWTWLNYDLARAMKTEKKIKVARYKTTRAAAWPRLYAIPLPDMRAEIMKRSF